MVWQEAKIKIAQPFLDNSHRGNQRQCYPNLDVTLLVFWWAMPTLRHIQGFSDRAMQIFTAIDPNLAYLPDADPRRDHHLAY
jgi:hypothetical protein